jgi:hypothetical protein
MPPTEIIFTSQPRNVPAQRVYLKQTWDGAWVVEPFLFCTSCTFTANPDMARAEFVWRYGRILPPGSLVWQEFSRLDRLRYFVKIEIDDPDEEVPQDPTPIVWYGIIEEDNGEQKGILAAPAEVGSGRQLLVAYGLDVMLSRHVLSTSTYIDHVGLETTLSRAIEFNAKTNFSTDEKLETGNRSEDIGDENAYVFASDLSTASFWTTMQAVQYLLAYQAPPNQIDDIEIRWALDPETYFLGTLPDFDKPRKPAHGRTLRQLLDELIDRRRLLGYTVDVDTLGTDDVIVVRPFTFAPEEITFSPDGDPEEEFIIPANASQKSIVFDGDSAVRMAVLKKASLEEIDQVICQGDRIVTCFTLDANEGKLVPHWDSPSQALYELAASGEAGYGALDLYEQQQRNEAYRRQERLKRVFSYFGLPAAWDGFIWNEFNTGHGPYFPASPADVDNPLPFYFPGLRFLSHLPLKTDHDYTDDKIENGTIVNSTPPGQKWEYLPPLVGIKIPDSSPTRWQLVDRLSTSLESLLAPPLGLDDGVKWSASVRVQDDEPGIIVTVHGKPQHILASGDFTPLPVVDTEIGSFDWHDDTFATVAMYVDKHVEGIWPLPAALPASQAIRRLIVELGDDFRQHYVARGTVLGIAADGTPFDNNEGGFIRDDQPQLEAMARLVFEWYRLPRQQLQLQFAYVTRALAVGDLITTVGVGVSLQTVNSVVTMVRYDFPEAEGAIPHPAGTTITTQFAEFDARRFLGHD